MLLVWKIPLLAPTIVSGGGLSGSTQYLLLSADEYLHAQSLPRLLVEQRHNALEVSQEIDRSTHTSQRADPQPNFTPPLGARNDCRGLYAFKNRPPMSSRSTSPFRCCAVQRTIGYGRLGQIAALSERSRGSMYVIRRMACRASTKARLTASVKSVLGYNNLVVNKLCIHDVMVCGEMWICRRYAPFGAASTNPELLRKVRAHASRSGDDGEAKTGRLAKLPLFVHVAFHFVRLGFYPRNRASAQ